MVEEARGEANFPTQHQAALEAARVSPSHVDEGGSSDNPLSAAQGPRPPVGLIWRIRDHRTFELLRRQGRRAREGPVTVVHLPEEQVGAPRVAYAIGRKAGNAVQRNRLRRRCRAVMAARAASPDGGLAPGAYLISAGRDARDLTYAELDEHISAALYRLVGREAG